MGELICHEIVSNFDTIIVLKRPCIHFADWGRPVPSTRAEIDQATSNYRRERRKKSMKSKFSRSLTTELDVPVVDDGKLTMPNTASPDNGEPRVTAVFQMESSKGLEQSIFGARLSDATQAIVIPTVLEAAETGHDDSTTVDINVQKEAPVAKVPSEPIKEKEIRFSICAGNLMSASPWFNRALRKNGWAESNRNLEDGCFYIDAEDWDEEAFAILMNIFHLRNHKVPRTMELETLAKFAILVDYYECEESVEVFVDMWLADPRLRTSIPTKYCRNLIIWIWVSWTFKLPDIFKQTTAAVIKHSAEPVRDLGLPIPTWITDEINRKRYRAIESIFSSMNGQLSIYRSAEYSCPISTRYSLPCGCMLLGALTKEMDSLNFMAPHPRAPFFGQSFDAICDRVCLMKSETWYHSSYDRHSCNVSTAMKDIVASAIDSVNGLELLEKLA